MLLYLCDSSMIEEKIVNYSKKIGIDLIGFVELNYFNDLEKKLTTQSSLGYKTPFQIGKTEDKTFKSAKYKHMKSAIVIGMAYNKGNEVYNKLKADEVCLSSYCWGKDYHIVLKEKLEKISELIKECGANTKILVDTHELDERYLAKEAGLGFYGLNNLLINEKYGSYIFIGLLLTDLSFKYSKPNNAKCYMCQKCINACPTKAINRFGILDGNKCLSYLTQKKHLENNEKKEINNCVFGCDICSLVCPHNANIKITNNFMFSGIELMKIDDFLNMPKEKFDTLYKENACFWRGKETIDRNVKIVKEKIDKKY